MLITLAVVDLGGEGLVPAVFVSRAESGGRRDDLVRRVQVQPLVDRSGALGRQRRGIDLQVGQHAVDDLAVFIDTVAAQAQAVSSDDVVVLVGLEGTGAGVAERAVVAQHEEALTLDAHVQHVAGVVDFTVLELLRYRCQAHTVTDVAGANAQLVGRVDVGEFRARRFETGGGDVGDVVAGHVQLLVGCIETAKADVERHVDSFCRLVGSTYQWFVLWTGQRCPARPD
ncbi:hypothetical protein D3C78_1321590 [compost metagenome]